MRAGADIAALRGDVEALGAALSGLFGQAMNEAGREREPPLRCYVQKYFSCHGHAWRMVS
jgi:hypothetical protein